MGLFRKWWAYTSDNVPLWKVFWLFWAAPVMVITLVFMLIFLVFNPHLLHSTPMDLKHSAMIFRRIIALFLLPMNLLGTYYIYKARMRCRLTYFSILGLIIIFFSTLEGIVTLIGMH